MTTFKAGLIQTNVSNDMAENVAFVREQARLARDAGAHALILREPTPSISVSSISRSIHRGAMKTYVQKRLDTRSPR